ncbi:MAG: SRPBCC family protein [Deltaproteobacteria bacterium]|nr:SRPBCC family protein [Deltaproteobacteria bacterium]
MKYVQSKKIFSILFILTAFSLVSLNAAAVDFTTAEKEKLKAGKTIKKRLATSGQKGFFGGSGYTLIDAPADVVWQAIKDWGAYDKMFSATSSVKEVAQKGNTSLIHYEMGYKMISLEYYMEAKFDKANYTMTFTLVESKPHDIDMAKGYWKLFPQPGNRTLVAYVVSAKVPMGVVNLLNDDMNQMVERNLIGAPNDVKKWLASAAGRKYFTRTARK